MDREIILDKHIIEAWGVWWMQWQKETKDRLRKTALSPQTFVDKHLVSSETKDFRANSTVGNVLLPK